MPALDSNTTDYEASLAVDAPPDQVLAALATADGISGWWTAWHTVVATPAHSDTLRFRFNDDTDQLVVHLETLDTTRVDWAVLDCAVLPDWVGTTPTFTLRPRPGGGTDIAFRHHGLSPTLECYDTCQAGWDQYLPSLKSYLTHATV